MGGWAAGSPCWPFSVVEETLRSQTGDMIFYLDIELLQPLQEPTQSAHRQTDPICRALLETTSLFSSLLVRRMFKGQKYFFPFDFLMLPKQFSQAKHDRGKSQSLAPFTLPFECRDPAPKYLINNIWKYDRTETQDRDFPPENSLPPCKWVSQPASCMLMLTI